MKTQLLFSVWMLFCILLAIDNIFAQQTSSSLAPTQLVQQNLAQQNLSSVVRVQCLSELICGVAIVGVPKEIRFRDAAAARFRIVAPPASEILLSLALPTRILGSNSDTPIQFGEASAAWSERDSPTLGVTTFNPMLPQRIKIPASGMIFLWIGCSLTPSRMLRSGRYTGLIRLDATTLIR
ncbi:MAG: hypothetical protein MUF71_01200 [Candidatus Kapabacteria bacterium]|nr:hypothetical protein [Candidatus Kapabacteria bacterium]